MDVKESYGLSESHFNPALVVGASLFHSVFVRSSLYHPKDSQPELNDIQSCPYHRELCESAARCIKASVTIPKVILKY